MNFLHAGEQLNPDVLSGQIDFPFLALQKASTSNFTIFDDDVCEYNQLVMAGFEFSASDLASGLNATKASPEITYLIIEDNDGKYLCCFMLVHFYSIVCIHLDCIV